MAQATHHPQRTETKTVVVEQEKVVLELTPREAAVVRAAMAGSVHTGFPEAMRIYTALGNAGIDHWEHNIFLISDAHGTPKFSERMR